MNISVKGKYSFYARERDCVANNEDILKKLDIISANIIERCK